jgi:hypothetical protein
MRGRAEQTNNVFRAPAPGAPRTGTNVLAFAPMDPPVDLVGSMFNRTPSRSTTPIAHVRISASTADSGLDAMQPLKRAHPGTARFLVPLPSGLTADSPELFGLFTYEFRAGHDDTRWSTARGRFGSPLRVTGVQHPAPALPCYVRRTEHTIQTSAPFAEAYAEGRDFNPSPRTEMWFLLYAQAREVSGASWRNVLLRRQRGGVLEEGIEPLTRYAATDIELAAAYGALRTLALSFDAPLSVLAVELVPAPLIIDGGNFNRYGDPLGADLGQVLRHHGNWRLSYGSDRAIMLQSTPTGV